MLKFNEKTIDIDLGREKLIKELSKANGAYADVGIFEGEEHPEGGEYTVAQIAAVHEYGTKPSTEPEIPERSFIRSTVDEKGQAWNAYLDEAYDRVKAGTTDIISALTAFGERAAGDVRRKITSLKTPPKAETTLKKEGPGFTNPLIWLGYMRAAVRSRIVVQRRETMTPKGPR